MAPSTRGAGAAQSPCLHSVVDPELAIRLAAFLDARTLGKALMERPPMLHGEPLDLCRLYLEVQRRGGYDTVDQWSEVAEAMVDEGPAGLGGALPAALALSVAYRRFLLDFEAAENHGDTSSGGSRRRVDAGSSRPTKRARHATGHYAELDGDDGGEAPVPKTAVPKAAPAATVSRHYYVDHRLEKVSEAAAVLSADNDGVNVAAEVRAINLLNRLSSDGDYELLLASVPELLDGVADALDRHNHLVHPLRDQLSRRKRDRSGWTSIWANHEGDSTCPPSSDAVAALSTSTLIVGLLSVVRNLSFIVANEDAIAFHTRTLCHLLSLLPMWSTDAGAFAADILAAVAKHLDVEGVPMPVVVKDDLDAPEDSLMALAPVRLRQNRAQALDPSRARRTDDQDYAVIVMSLFQTVMEMAEQEERVCVLRALDCLSKLIQVEDNAHVLARHVPTPFLLRLQELLHCPAVGPDSLTKAPMPAYAMTPGFTFQEWEPVSDTEVRDAALEVLAPLCGIHETQTRLLSLPSLLRTLILLLSARMGKPDVSRVAARMVCQLTSSRQGGVSADLTVHRPLLLHLSLRAQAAAEVYWTMFLAPAAEGEGAEEEQDEGATE